MNNKPLGRPSYGSISHLPTSRLGPGDHHCDPGHARIACEKTRDRHDTVYVTEKLDGSCVSVAKLHGEIVPLIRSGHKATDSKYEQHWLFHAWALRERSRFLHLLGEGQRIVGEWLAQAHGTLYNIPKEPFVVFDLFTKDNVRVLQDEFIRRVSEVDLITPKVIHCGGAYPVENLICDLSYSGMWTSDPEGAVWRVERNDPRPNGRGRYVDFLVKWVRHNKKDGCYLPEVSGSEPVWNWMPEWWQSSHIRKGKC